MNAECQNCGRVCAEESLNTIKHLVERVAPGEPMPSGECPECGAVCHPTAKPLSKVKLRMTVDVTYDPNGESVESLNDKLKAIIQDAAGNGQMTGDTGAEVDIWTAEVKEITELD